MKLFVIGLISFIISMVILFLVDFIPNPHNWIEWIIVLVVSFGTIALPFWVGLIQKLWK